MPTLPDSQGPAAQPATDCICPSLKLHGGQVMVLGQQQGAQGSPAHAPAPLLPLEKEQTKTELQSAGTPPRLVSMAANGTKGNCGQKDLPKVLLLLFLGKFQSENFSFSALLKFFPLSPHRADKKPNAISAGKEIFSSPLSCAFSRKEKKILIKLEEGEAH